MNPETFVMPPNQSPHAAATFSTESEEIESRLDRETPEQAEAATSSHLVRMIDFFFALVLGQGLIRFADVVEAPFAANVPVWIALVLIYYTVVRSFVAWHAAIETRRYKMSSKVRTTELWRVYIDVLIVAAYAYMLFCAEPLIEHGGADMHRLLWAFPMLFILYGVWGHFRRVAWGDDGFNLKILAGFCGLYVLIAAAYTVIPSNTFSISDETANILVLTVCLVAMGVYRYINFWQETQDRARWPWNIPRPRVPSLRAWTEG
ncbi:MAG: hypothetical protein JJE35_04050 [Thermoleophilia bacterium]|nr:hypothetical protein [Thermoleophilia bacterium]